MACTAEEMTFEIFELYPDGKESEEIKRFSISKTESDELCESVRYGAYGCISETGIILAVFKKFYHFTIGTNGFVLKWDTDAEGKLLKYQTGYFYWGGPRPPAVPIGGNWWRIKRVA